MNETYLKSARLLHIYSCLIRGDTLVKAALADQFHVSQKSIQRDIDMLRCFLADEQSRQDLIYDPKTKGYKLVDKNSAFFNNDEILAVCKILLASRSMIRAEMEPILDKLVDKCVPAENAAAVRALIANEKHHYVEPRHQTPVLPLLWEIGTAIKKQRTLDIDYLRTKDQKIVTRRVWPVGLMFSEFYFYLVAYIEGINRKEHFDNPADDYPTIYRIDRIKAVRLVGSHFSIPYKDRFEEGEFRNRVQFMYGGRLQTVRFHYTGPSIEAILDRLPSAHAKENADKGWDITAEVFGTGIEMWLKSQGKWIDSVSIQNC